MEAMGAASSARDRPAHRLDASAATVAAPRLRSRSPSQRRSRRASSGSMQAPVELIELEPSRLPMPPRQARAPPPTPPTPPIPAPAEDERSDALLQSGRALYSSPMRPSQYVARPSAPEADESQPDARRRREAERVSLEQVLLRCRWEVHSVSPLFHFRTEQLSAYAHDLLKSLRATALRKCGQQFGYSVSIRNASDASVVFLVREDRRAGARRRASLSEQGRRQLAQQEDDRAAAFVLFFPSDKEKRKPRKGREEQQVLMLRGNEELLAWSCSWLQRSFQCVVDTRAMRVTELNLRRLARNLTISSLMEQQVAAQGSDPVDAQRQAAGEMEEVPEHDEEEEGRKIPAARAPLVLLFQNPDPRAPMQTYTMTVPWEALRRMYAKISADSKNGGNNIPGLS